MMNIDKLKVIPMSVDYKVFNDKVVVCTLKYSVEYPDVYFGSNEEFYTVTGKAKCSYYDIFDFETGKRIAESRATLKLYKIIKNYMRNYMREVKNGLISITNDYGKINRMIDTEDRHYKTLIKDAE